MIKRLIPNIITLCNLLCGVLAIVFIFNNITIASYFILAGAFFDFFDGLVARWLKVESKIGKELDSLADVVTFGVAPSLIAFSLLKNSLGIYALIPLLMSLMSAYRLAKFNIDSRQTTSFLGIPTPLNALLWLSIPIISHLSNNKQHLWGWYNEDFYSILVNFLTSSYFVIIASIVMSVLLIIEIPMIALKFKTLKWKDNQWKFIFLALSIILLFVINLYAIPFIAILYIIISLISNITKNEIHSRN
ncbi:MAG: CDP-diacylglycerol--serine O-phosphatidyltransferase [Bacteroidales bacterium]|jgi:CDP-diacylglycerol--serine O-phosphatidyltransferase|nr:CDP-diacylglycerol--serine O-phosphatidyltransferase [Bacteroidales bacterium]